MGKIKWIALLLIVFLIGAIAAYALQQFGIHVPSTGTVVEPIAIYIDDMKWVNGTNLDWDDVVRGSTYYVNLTVVNTGDTTLTVSLNATYLPTGITSAWTPNATSLLPGEMAVGDWTLTVASDAPLGPWSHNFWVRGEQT